MLCLVDGAPKILPINQILKEYLNFQIEVIERRTKFLLDKDEARDHIVVGLLKAIDVIDKVIETIKAAPTPEEATRALMENFGFTEVQTQAILAMTLRRLTGLEANKLEEERKQLEANIANYKHILESRENVTEVVVQELLEIKEKYGDQRRTEISDASASIEDESLIPQNEIVITLTTNNYVKRMPIDTFRTQHRGGRGVKGMTTNDEDNVSIMVFTHTHTDILFFSSLGKVYRLRGYMIPEGSRVSKGLPIQNLLDLDKGEKIMSIISLDEYNPDHYLFFITRNGLVKRTQLSEYESIRKNGKIAISLREGDQLFDVKHIDDQTVVSLATAKGKVASFKVWEEVRPLGRTASGVIGMDTDGSPIVGVATSLEGKYILAISKNGYGKMTEVESYTPKHRGTKGVVTLNCTPKVGRLVALRAVNGDEDLMMVTTGGVVIRIPLEQVKVAGRNTQGVRVIRLEDEKQKVASLTVVPHEDDAEEEATEEVVVEAKTEE